MTEGRRGLADRPVAQASLDAVIWAVAVPIGSFLRFDFSFDRVVERSLVEPMLIAVIAQLAFGFTVGLYRRRFRYASFDELVMLAVSMILVTLLLSAVTIGADVIDIPRSVPALSSALALLLMVTVRALSRLQVSRARRPLTATPVVVLGAGGAAHDIVRMLLAYPDSAYRPVALLDDDPLKSQVRTVGVRVEGTLDDLESVARRHHAGAALLAIPSGSSELVRRARDLAAAAGLPLLALPSAKDLFAAPRLSDIRPVSEADLLGRDAADIDPDAVAEYITGKRVLVTGAGGSIGSELCRQLARFEPSALIMLDRDESGLHSTQLSVEGRAMLDSPNLVLADIRDGECIRSVFERLRPHVVFHAAALKHLTLLERYPDEAWKSNVDGSQIVLEAAAAVGVERFVNISTDKAANPTSVLGFSKRLTERLTAQMAADKPGTFVSVRFGNVLGSRGSVLTAFRAQAESGGPITVTDRDVTRYFMTVHEAVRLTIYAGAIGRDGEVLVLDMGAPVRILDVAQRFAGQQSPAAKIVFTGLRPGEKLHEELFGEGETDVRPVHPLISHVAAPPITIDEARGLCALYRRESPDPATRSVIRVRPLGSVTVAESASPRRDARPSDGEFAHGSQ